MTNDKPAYGGSDRRANPRLRELIDEMLASIRASQRIELWTDDERKSYESQLARIMDSVRSEALVRGHLERERLG